MMRYAFKLNTMHSNNNVDFYCVHYVCVCNAHCCTVAMYIDVCIHNLANTTFKVKTMKVFFQATSSTCNSSWPLYCSLSYH